MANTSIVLKIDRKKLTQLVAKAPGVVSNIIRQETEAIRQDAEDTSPRDTGYLASTHDAEFPGLLEGHVHVTAPYAGFVHDGARGRAPRPWLLQAAMARVDEMTQLLQQAIDDAAK